MANPDWMGSKHAALGLKCLDCHPATALQETHKNVTTAPPPKLGPEKYSDSVCLTCHGSYAALIELTRDSKDFLSPEGKAVNPHDPPHEEKLECNECHQIHQMSPSCFGCHHMGFFDKCETCH